MPDRVDSSSLDVASQRRAELKALFPSVFAETRNEQGALQESIDFEKLKAELGTFSDVFENRRERYGMDWPGKKDCLKLVQQRSLATLNPCRDASVNFDSTENLVIEGDNLEVLKLLQKSYYGRVKVIYIDPPYNTGHEFIYPDNYAESLDTYLEYAGLIDSEGKRFATNTVNEGRFHTKWLNLMYPRLYLARNLLRADGVIFISIDENELQNLRLVCNEVFGEENFAGCITVLCNPKGRSQDKYFATNHEYVLVYCKAVMPRGYFSIAKDEDQIAAEYPEEDEGGPYRLLELRNTHREFGKHNRRNLFYPLYVNSTGEVFLHEGEDRTGVLPNWDDGFEGCWTWDAAKAAKDIGLLVAQQISGRWKVYRKSYASGADRMLKTILIERSFYTERGQKEFNQLFETRTKLFQSPKSPFLLSQLFQTVTSESDLILDFFAGSGTTAQAVFELNKQDGGNRKFILVQLPEPCAEESEAFKAGFNTISDIAMERVRRVIQKLDDEDRQSGKSDSGEKQDRGFRVLTLGGSHFRQWPELPTDASMEQVVEQLVMHVDHIEPHVDPEDLLFEVLIKAGIAPTAKIETAMLAGLPVYSISQGEILVCLAEAVTQELIDAVAKAAPKQFLCLDRAFLGNDQLRANASQTFEARQSGRENVPTIAFRTI